MARAVTLGNGSLLVGIGRDGHVRDIYFPYVGLENQVGSHNSHAHRVGVWVDGVLHWLSDAAWKVTVECDAQSFAGKITATNDQLGVVLRITDVVYNEKNVFVRKVLVRNMREHEREIKLYFSHQFEMYESHLAHTAYYDPMRKAIVHYRGQRVFVIRTALDGNPFDDYTTGVFGIEGKAGSHADAREGALSRNPIEHGPADSVVGVYDTYAGNEEKEIFYTMVVATSLAEAQHMDESVLSKTPAHIVRTTMDFWKAWVTRRDFSFHGLDANVQELFAKSLFIIRAHADNGGAIIASTDSDMLQGGKDTYSYMWPRDGARTSVALYESGAFNVARRFFQFAHDTITPEGYFMHKYGPDKTLGSSWHPWVRDGKPVLPIQEDETALVVHALWEYYELSKDIEFIEKLYNPLIKRAAEFMVTFRDRETFLPRPSYDLWEEKYGVHTFTACSVFAALQAATKFAALLGKRDDVSRYSVAAAEVKAGVLQHLYSEDTGLFYKMINSKDGDVVVDATYDSSTVYALFVFGVLKPDDERMVRAVEEWEKRLVVPTDISGVLRYENDAYRRTAAGVPSNPWVITTCWLAQYYITKATSEEDMAEAKKWLEWVTRRALPSGMLPEQLHPYTGEAISATPLTWSHSAFVVTVLQYMTKLEELGICPKCGPKPE